ncbi:MAG: hypothetical protein JO211_16435, partial [Acidobacteriaceae bacterium]|nr:hypothetical protein [Acidobacteriaceae bacterium]
MTRNFWLAFALTAALVGVGLSRQTGESSQSFAGRWDLTVQTPDRTYPSWIEVTQNGSAP